MLTRNQCLSLLEEYKVPEAVKKHCIKVAEVALKICDALRSAGLRLDCQAVESAALLHDIARGSPRHAEEGQRLLRAMGEEDLANIVAQHMVLEEQEKGRISEVALVYLADKFVSQDAVVSLEERFSARSQDFANNQEALEGVWRNRETAERICSLIKDITGTEVFFLITQ
ncbi:MAG: HD domain-containing protein [Bacillota bacterium]|jgi:molybdenum cofactor cytidylyltransferase